MIMMFPVFLLSVFLHFISTFHVLFSLAKKHNETRTNVIYTTQLNIVLQQTIWLWRSIVLCWRKLEVFTTIYEQHRGFFSCFHFITIIIFHILLYSTIVFFCRYKKVVKNAVLLGKETDWFLEPLGTITLHGTAWAKQRSDFMQSANICELSCFCIKYRRPDEWYSRTAFASPQSIHR